MKSRFLSLTLGFLIALTVFVAPVKKANAGIALLAAAATYDENYYYYGGGCFFFSSTYIIYPANGLEIFALMMIILDQKGEMDKTGVAKALESRFPFIDNSQIVNNLVSKIDSQRALGKTYVTIDEKSVREVLSASDLAETEIQEIVTYLK